MRESLLLVDFGAGQHRLGASALTYVYNRLGDTVPDVDDSALLSGLFNAIQALNASQQSSPITIIRWRCNAVRNGLCWPMRTRHPT